MESCKFRNHPVGPETYRMDHPVFVSSPEHVRNVVPAYRLLGIRLLPTQVTVTDLYGSLLIPIDLFCSLMNRIIRTYF